MNRSFYISVLLSISFISLSMKGQDSLALEREMELPDKTIFDRIYTNTASAMYRPDYFSNGKLEAGYRYENNEKLSMLQDGQNFSNYQLSAKGQTLKDNKIFWGEISYRRFERDSVRWSDMYDYKRVGPYVIGSELTVDKDGRNKNSISGGDVFGEEYNLLGGLSIQFGEWILGGEAGYIAGHSYRRKDPRPLSNATDLYLQLSMSYNLFNNYQVGLSGEARRYREKIEIKAENDSKRYSFYLFKGFGQTNPIYSETDNTNYSQLYEGVNYSGSFFFIPKDRNGFLGNINYNYGYIEPNASSISRPYTYNTYTFLADLGWQKMDESGLSFVKLSYDNQFGKGIERIYQYMNVNDVFGQQFLLYAAQFYSKKTSMTKLSIGHEWFSTKRVLWFVADAAIENYNERYAYPYNKAAYQHLWGSLELGGKFEISKLSSLIPRLKYEFRHRLSDPELNINLFGEDLRLYQSISAQNYDIVFSNLNTLVGEITYQHKIKNRMSVYTKSSGYLTFNKAESKHGVNVSVGLIY